MFCPSCGSQIPDESKLCPSCGADVSEASSLVAQINEVAAQVQDTPEELPAAEPLAQSVPAPEAEPVVEAAAEQAPVPAPEAEPAVEAAAEPEQQVSQDVQDVLAALAGASHKASVPAPAVESAPAAEPAPAPAAEPASAVDSVPAAEPAPAAPTEQIPPVAPTEFIPQATAIPQPSGDSAPVVDASAPIDPTTKMPTPQPSPQPAYTGPATEQAPYTGPVSEQGVYTGAAAPHVEYTAPGYQTGSTVTPVAPKKKRSFGKVILGAIAALFALALATGAATCSCSFNNEPVVEISGSEVEEIDSFDTRCLDSNGNITTYALTELEGSELSQLLRQEGYEWDSSEECWLRDSDAAAYGASNNLADEEMMNRSQLKRLKAGGKGKPVVFINSVAGYGSAFEALEGNMQIKVDDSIDAETMVIAKAEDGNGRGYIVIVFPHTDASDELDGTMDLLIFNEEAVEEGMVTDLIGFDLGDSVDEVWEEISGNLGDAESSLGMDI